MALATQSKVYPHIARDPDVSGGRPFIEGTRIPVTTVVRAHQLGMDFDEILVQFPGLRPGALHAALAYYLDHQAEVDAMLEDDDRPVPGAIEVSV